MTFDLMLKRVGSFHRGETSKAESIRAAQTLVPSPICVVMTGDIAAHIQQQVDSSVIVLSKPVSPSDLASAFAPLAAKGAQKTAP